MNQSKKITEGAMLTAVYIILLLIIVFVPIIQIIGIFLLPVPFIMYTSKHGFTAGILMLIIASILAMILATLVTLPLTLLAGIGGIAVGSGMYSEKNAYETWAQGTLGHIAGFVVVLFLIQVVFQINLFQELDTALNESMDTIRSIIGQVNITDDVEKPLELVEEQMQLMKEMVPVGIAILSIIMAFIGQWLTYKIINRVERKQFAFPAFKNLDFPIAVIWIFFLAIILSIMDLDPDGILFTVVLNIEALCVFLLVIQGFSFIFFYMDLKKIHQAVPITIVILSLFLPFIFMFIVRIIGIIDLGFRLKQRLRQQKP
ncbi:MAG TPA: YybS family protein [Pseudogracilibacillus sp.]|nr:YybS family protein [Pseudogracilibacillus sp.]